MKKIIRICSLCFVLVFVNCNRETPEQISENLSQYVNPNIGTAHSRWFFYTPAALPFGMAKLAPSTNGSYGNKSGWEAVGYDARHTSIEGFAQLHEFQIGGFLFTAITGGLKTTPGSLENPDEGYRSRFTKKNEVAQPGYYKVQLDDYDVQVELTATKRVGLMRYTFPETEEAYIIFDIGNQLGESGKVKDAHVKINSNGDVEGYVITYPEYVKKYQKEGDIKMYFYTELSKKATSFGGFNKGQVYFDTKEAKGVGAGLFLKYTTQKDEAIVLKTGLSYTSIANAKANLHSEVADLSFDEALIQAKINWENELDKIRVTDSDVKNKTKFYTALFHALLGRGLTNDVNGAFPQNDGSIGQVPVLENGELAYNIYNTDAVWGAFWNLTQLWALAWPDYYNDFLQSQLEVYKNSEWLADGTANGRYVSGVGTNFTSLILASGYQTGILKTNIDLAYEAALKNELSYVGRKRGAGKMDLKGFVEQGFINYIPGDKTAWLDTPAGGPFSVSHSLEYAFSSYAVAQMAEKLGKQQDYRLLMKQAGYWKRYFDDETQLFRPVLKNGAFMKNFDPLKSWEGFQEGNAWQYTFYVPHQPKKLVELLGEDRFNRRLDSIFTISAKTDFGGVGIDAFAGIETLYNHGNQPNLHISWLFNFSGKPWLTQKWTRLIGNQFYGDEEIHGYGYGQDEDQGQLGAWYVMSSIGLFDVKGLTEKIPNFQFGSPIFDKVSIKVANKSGKRLQLMRKNSLKSAYYIKSLKWQGKEYDTLAIPFKTLLKGGDLEFYMDTIPHNNLHW